MSSYPGPVSELPNISIDNFDGDNQMSTCFFLTHCHMDHMKGLDQKFFTFLKKNPGYYLYCSPFTRNILTRDGNISDGDLSNDNDFIKEFEGKMVITVPGRDDTKTVSYYVTVTALPVDHCLGAVMYLFETREKKVLFTGDFRIYLGDIQKFRELKPYHDGFDKIDKIYFDATFMSEEYLEFPKKSESLQQISDIIKDWLDAHPNNHVNIRKSSKYGYEDVFIELAKKFKCLIHVDWPMYKVYSKVPEIASKLTPKQKNSRIHHCYDDDNIGCDPEHLCTVRLSAQRFQYKNGFDSVKSEDGYHVCYATHSSLSEIYEFLDYFRPSSFEPLSYTLPNDEGVPELCEQIRNRWAKTNQM